MPIDPRILGRPSQPATPAAPKSVRQCLIDAVGYPVRGSGWAIIVAGAFCYWFARLVSSVALGIFARPGGFCIAMFTTGYVLAYMMKIVFSSACGEDDPPDWPDLTSLWEGIFKPIFQFLAVAAIGFLPLIVLMMSLDWTNAGPLMQLIRTYPDWGWGDLQGSWASLVQALAYILPILGLLYLPMALLAMAMLEWGGLNPLVVVQAIRRGGASYLMIVGAIAAACLLNWLARVLAIPFVGGILRGMINLYCLMATMRLLGLLYRMKEKALDWDVK